ncbi:alpha/beta hydrolase [Halostella sp. JP-L12]|uniref:alpha/beta fold hydrolase n=1 Tax=Halostella TaxID=1843185 RepID=UPI000EF7D351|nr:MULTISPECIES: alpha/beta hydrolase [Halostella]NHN49914.1 alpha/beta hydrolase [Halostella sp. JP-L12]
MKLRRLAAAAAGGLGATALANAALARRADPLDPPLPGDQGTYRWRGIDVAYTEAGDPEDPDVALFHGVNLAGSSREFDAVFDRLAENHHVLAPDLPGFGRSDRPPLLYSASLYESFVADFLADLTADATVVASSLTGAYAVRAAGRTDVSRLVLVCPSADSMGDRDAGRRLLFRLPLVGTAAFNLLASKPSIRYFGADHGYYDASNVPEEEIEYQWQSAHQPGARYAPASFLSGFLGPEMDLEAELAALDVPVTLVWGREAEVNPLSAGRDLAEAADARLVVVDYARLLPHAEHPDQFLDAVRAALPRIERE